MQGIGPVDDIMIPLHKHIKEGADPKTNKPHYNIVYEAVMKIVAENTKLKEICEARQGGKDS